MENNILLTLKNTKGIGLRTIKSLKTLIGTNIKKDASFYSSSLNVKFYLRYKLKQYKLDVLLTTIIYKRIHSYINSKNFKGIRFKNRYPVRGQRTHTNAKTQRRLIKQLISN
jgi:ribosomal protein S13